MDKIPQNNNSSLVALLLTIFLFLPQSVNAVILSTSSFFSETNVVFDVLLDTEGQCVNAGAINISFNHEHYTVVSVDTLDSLFDLWIAEPLINQEDGYIFFEGGVLWGYCGDSEEVSLARITLEKKTHEVVSLPNIVIDNTSRVLLHDGRGTEAVLTIAVNGGNTVD